MVSIKQTKKLNQRSNVENLLKFKDGQAASSNDNDDYHIYMMMVIVIYDDDAVGNMMEYVGTMKMILLGNMMGL